MADEAILSEVVKLGLNPRKAYTAKQLAAAKKAANAVIAVEEIKDEEKPLRNGLVSLEEKIEEVEVVVEEKEAAPKRMPPLRRKKKEETESE